MQRISFRRSLQIQNRSVEDKNPNRNSGYFSIMLGTAAGILSALLGFLLLGIHSLTGASNRLENYAGVSLLVVAFICFGVSTHFMDKADEKKRLDRKIRFERFEKNNQFK